jgi:hypothetical protein
MQTSPTIIQILNELNAADAIRRTLHAAKLAVGGRVVGDPMITEQWIGLPDDFDFTARNIILNLCKSYGVTPESIGYVIPG